MWIGNEQNQNNLGWGKKKKPLKFPIQCYAQKKGLISKSDQVSQGLVWLRFENHQEQKRYHFSWLTYYSTKLLNLTALVVKDYFALYPAGSFPAAAGASRPFPACLCKLFGFSMTAL